jgi:YVTN family beta-propeller protein
MKRRRILLAVLCLLVAGGVANTAQAGTTYFDMTDEPGRWFDRGAANNISGTQSLAIVTPGEKIVFLQKSSKFGMAHGQSRVESRHTITSLIWPSTTTSSELIDQEKANHDDQEVTLTTPGLHVFVCKVHPYMLGAVIVDADGAQPLDIGAKLHLLGTTNPSDSSTALPSYSDLALRLLRTFFVVTNPANWKDYTQVGVPYDPSYPPVAVTVYDKFNTMVPVDNLNATLKGYFGPPVAIDPVRKPLTPGVGEVWVDTQFEVSQSKGAGKPSTMTVVDVGNLNLTKNWKVKQKIALPDQKMNNGHNMWASHDQKQIYQTEWHGKSLFVIDRASGQLLKEIEVGHDPAHVMTRVDTEQVHVTLNGQDSVVELDRKKGASYLQIKRLIPMQLPGEKQAQPHAHWMGFDGKTMATPNSNTADSTLYDFEQDRIRFKIGTGALPIAAAMMPDSSKYYVSNYLGNSTSVINTVTGQEIAHINLLQNYVGDVVPGVISGPVGALPIQTPVSPDGKFVITGNTLTGTITIIDTASDTLVAMVPCDPGCHGVNFGAKKEGGYYAYVTSKFSNRLIVLDYDPNNNGILFDDGGPTIAGWVVLADNAAPTDDTIIGNKGMGGQGVLPIPIVYNGWVQKLPQSWKDLLTAAQLNPAP